MSLVHLTELSCRLDERRLSYNAFKGALMIYFYRDVSSSAEIRNQILKAAIQLRITSSLLSLDAPLLSAVSNPQISYGHRFLVTKVAMCVLK